MKDNVDMIAQEMVCTAERADGKGKVEGYYFCMRHNDGRKHLHHFIMPIGADLSEGTPIDKIQVPVKVESIMLKVQEPVKPYMDFDGHDVWRCGNCGAAIFHLDHTQADEDAQNYAKFCRQCGQAVNWIDC